MMLRFLPALALVCVALGVQADLGQAFREGRYDTALAIADRMLKERPRDPMLWTARGMALAGLRRQGDSLASFDKALTIAPGYVPALKGAAQAAYRAASPRAGAYLDRLLELTPEDATAHAMAGALAFEARRCAGAIRHFERGGEAVEGSEVAISQYGACLLESGRAAESVPLFERALRRFPESRDLRFNLALSQMQAKQPEAASASLAPLVASGRADAGTLNLLAAAQDAAGQLAQAIRSLERAVQLAPGDERNYMDLATLSLEHENASLAVEYADAGLRRLPGSARLYTVRGIARAQTGQIDAAEADFDLAARLSPDQAYASVAMSVLYRQRDELDKAAALLRDKLRGAPNDPTLNYLLADSLLRIGVEPGEPRFEEARDALQRALKAKPEESKALARLGKLYLKEGRVPEAVQTLERAVRIDPMDRMALNQLLISLRRAGRSEQASLVAKRLAGLLDQERLQGATRDGLRMARADASTY